MIKEIRMENIRVFEGTGWSFPLSPLTVFCGTNNSGKSTLLKVLLLLRQSMGIGESYTHEQGKLRFFGSQVDLGSYRSLVSHNEYQRDISISLTTEGYMPIEVANNLRSLRAAQEKPTPSISEDAVLYSLEVMSLYSCKNEGGVSTLWWSTDHTALEGQRGYSRHEKDSTK